MSGPGGRRRALRPPVRTRSPPRSAAPRSAGPARSLPQATLDACRGADAVLLGAVGDPAYDAAPREQRPEYALLTLRKALERVRQPAAGEALAGPRGRGPAQAVSASRGTDLCFVRELTGGLYFGEPRGLDAGAGEAVNTLRYSRDEVVRVAEVAFRLRQAAALPA
ncbi:MAG: isocitrate/isopropylmalate family dehydrogenase [Ignavibacteriales bacterium]|nr:isocitrate/isopropylmalate family dehydrogenase [Ignavibacteriales bacterium]